MADDPDMTLARVLSRGTSLDSVTYLQFEGGETTPMHVHRDLLHLTVTESGKALCVVGQTRYVLTGGTAIFIYPNEVHSFTADEQDPYLSFTVKIRIDGVLAPGLPRSVDISSVWDDVRQPLLRMTRLADEETSLTGSLRIQASLLDVLAAVLCVPQNRVLADAPPGMPEAMDKTLAILQEPPFVFPGIDCLAAINGMSRRSFTEHFRSVTGFSPRMFQVAARMNRAEGLLASGMHSVKEVAGLCGYSNSQNFIRAYRRHFGSSPGRWQRRNGGTEGH